MSSWLRLVRLELTAIGFVLSPTVGEGSKSYPSSINARRDLIWCAYAGLLTNVEFMVQHGSFCIALMFLASYRAYNKGYIS